jgi:transcriptional regulator with XRE-family HTH domain
MNQQVIEGARDMISGFLTSRRKELGITQEQLADMSGMGVATIRRFESGRFWLNLKQYLILCHYLKCYPFIAEADSDHPLAVDMRKRMNEVNSFKKRAGDSN